MGPFEARLKGFGKIEALVVGQRGECSKDLHTLVGDLAASEAVKVWRSSGARSPAECRVVMLNRFRRMIGISGARSAATLKRECLGVAIGDGAAAARRRRFAAFRVRTMREECFDRFGSGPMGGRGGS
jgi:hypothetical protein